MEMSLRMVTIDVTQEDIDRGNRANCRFCPIAMAIDRLVKPGVEAWIDPWSMAIFQGDKLVADFLVLSQSMSDFIGLYDAGHYVPPSRFSFELPEECLR